MHKFSPSDFIAWLEKQPTDGTYEPLEARDCLFGKYLQAAGSRSVVSESIRLVEDDDDLYDIACRSPPYTFGAALARARAVLTAHD